MTKHGLAIVAGLAIAGGIGLTVGSSSRDALPSAIAQQSATGAAAVPPGQDEQNIIRVARQISPAVVSISRSGGSGSGVIVRSDGIVLTNAHVVGNVRAVEDAIEQIIATGRVVRAFLGIQYADIEPELARQFRLPTSEGILITGVAQGTPAARAGLVRGDIITRLDGTAIRQGGDLRRTLRERRPGDTIRITVAREDRSREVSARLVAAPSS